MSKIEMLKLLQAEFETLDKLDMKLTPDRVVQAIESVIDKMEAAI